MTSSTGSDGQTKVLTALHQWRDSLISLTGRNRLLNYRPTRASTIEFTRHTPAEVYSIISSATLSYTMGTRPAEKPKAIDTDDEDVTSNELEQAVLDQLDEFDFDDFPNHLFADKTQRDVDKALRTLSSTSKREFIDKGLRTLYVALGELQWKEDSGDERRSPLFLIPADLETLGPRERMFLRFSEDDPAVNPALARRVEEDYGITLPSTEEVIETLESEGVDRAIGLFRDIAWPEGWEVRDFTCLGVFMFAKEAMYRDLLNNEDEILESPLIQTLSGGIKAEDSTFSFESYGDGEIDEVAPPEAAQLVLDADSSQRAAVQAAIEGKSFTLDGPPGTGKSQTIANIIGALIEAGKTVLFVSEKAVALDVVRDRLTENGLDPFVFDLHSSKALRKDVATRLGSALNSKPVPPPGMSSVKLNQLRDTRLLLTQYVVAANELRQPIESSFHQVLGWLEQVRTEHVGPAFVGDAREITAGTLARIESLVGRIAKNWELHLSGDRAIWHGLIRLGETRFVLQQLAASLDKMHPILTRTKELRASFGFESIDGLERTEQLLKTWHAEPAFHEDPWLDQTDFVALASAVGDYELATARLDQAEAEALLVIGDEWQSMRPTSTDRIPELDVNLLELPGLSMLATAYEVSLAKEGLSEAAQGLNRLEQLSHELADQLGAEHPRSADDVRLLLEATRACLSAHPPTSEWCYDADALFKARDIAHRTRLAQEDLEAAESAASDVFTSELLGTDLNEIDRLEISGRGFFKRFGANHKALREALGTISSAKWKVALAELPKARTWVKASDCYIARAAEASAALPKYFEVDRATDWESLERCFDNADVAATYRFNERLITERFLANSAVQRHADELVNSLEDAYMHWEVSCQKWTVKGGRSDALFPSLANRLEHRNILLEPIVALVNDQVEHLGGNASLETHFKAAATRVAADTATEGAKTARARLGELVRLSSVGAKASSLDADVMRRKLKWAHSVLATISDEGQGPANLTSAQIQALEKSIPIPEVGVLLKQYQALAKDLIGWFDETRHAELREDLQEPSVARDLVAGFQENIESVDDWFALQRVVADLDEVGLGPALSHAQTERLPQSDVSDFLKATVYRRWLDAQVETDARLDGSDGSERDDLVKLFRELDSELAGAAVARIIEAGAARRPRTSIGQGALIQREAQKKRKHIPVRDLIDQTRDVILALHPCFMMSPLAVSQYLPADMLFDVVIFDEASQVLPSDAINSIYRGSALIAAGDQKQLPPTSFFEAAADELDEDGDEDVASDFESILDLMKASGSFNAQSLRWHYRSRHEHLIAYSNSSFYESKLVTFPGALAESDDAGVRFFAVPGVYRRAAGRDNPIEAKHVAERVMHHYATRPEKSLGVVAFSTAQRDAIESAIELARVERPDLDGYFGDDRTQGFFVKNLESVQGDERDVIIFSIGYGPDENGKIYKQFGPLSRKGGERRLNVAITRAKELVEVVSSITAADIGEVNSAGARHLRRYLDFVERGPAALYVELGPSGLDTESPFEDAVVSYVRSLGFEVQPQVGVAGYRLDIGVKHPNQPGAFMLGIECDGAMYHSSLAARDRDRLRHQVLEGLGWHIHHVWGTAWYRHPDREKVRLRSLLEDFASRPVKGRVTPPTLRAAAPVTFTHVERPIDDDPDWVVDYKVAEPAWISSGIDLSETYNAHYLTDFVEEVARVEGPVHLQILIQRLREHSAYDRVGARMRATLIRAVQLSNVRFESDFIDTVGSGIIEVRRGTTEFTRTIEHLPEEELGHAIELLVADVVGISRVELTTRIAKIFGWKRTGAEIRNRIEAIIDFLVREGIFSESSVGLRST